MRDPREERETFSVLMCKSIGQLVEGAPGLLQLARPARHTPRAFVAPGEAGHDASQREHGPLDERNRADGDDCEPADQHDGGRDPDHAGDRAPASGGCLDRSSKRIVRPHDLLKVGKRRLERWFGPGEDCPDGQPLGRKVLSQVDIGVALRQQAVELGRALRERELARGVERRAKLRLRVRLFCIRGGRTIGRSKVTGPRIRQECDLRTERRPHQRVGGTQALRLLAENGGEDHERDRGNQRGHEEHAAQSEHRFAEPRR